MRVHRNVADFGRRRRRQRRPPAGGEDDLGQSSVRAERRRVGRSRVLLQRRQVQHVRLPAALEKGPLVNQ